VSDLVSILIPCFNGERWIADAVESALAQSWPSKEVIVVDDGSTDGSLKAIRQYDALITWEAAEHRGGNPTRNRLLELARGEWLQYLDADDYLLPGKVAAQMRYAVTHTDIDVLLSPVIWEYWSEQEIRRSVKETPWPEDVWSLLARWSLPQTGGPLWRRRAMCDVGGWTPDQPCCQDEDMYLRLLMAGKRFEYCPEPGAVYRQWSELTVCKRDKPEVYRRRLEIEEKIERFLHERGALTPQRLSAINQARLEVARLVWQYDTAYANRIVGRIHCSQPDFVPTRGAAPALYRVLFRCFGFARTQRLATWKRQFVGPQPTA